MNQANGAAAPASTASAAGNSCDGRAPRFGRETSLPAIDFPLAPRRYSNGVEMSQRHNGETAMNAHYQLLAGWGYSIIWASGDYCQAIRGDRDTTFRWNGEQWVEL